MAILRISILVSGLWFTALPSLAEEAAHGLLRNQTDVDIVVLAETYAAQENAAKTIDFYDLLVTQRIPQVAADKYVDPDYIQHNPMLADGP